MDIFETRAMLQAIEQFKPPKTFLLDTFFKGSIQFDTKNVDIDIYKGKRRMAPFVHPMKEGKVIDKIGYQTRTYTPPYVKPWMPTTAQEVLLRTPGTTVYPGGESASTRAARILGDNLKELDEIITRREEWMAAQALDTGTIHVVGDGVDDTIDFTMDSNHKITLTGNALWTATSTCNPLVDLQTWSSLCAKDSGMKPKECVMGVSAYNAFVAYYLAKAVPNPCAPIRIQLGSIDPKEMPEGASYAGTINVAGAMVDVYTYEEWYIDDNGVEQPMVPVDKVWLGNSNAQNKRLYGAILDMEAQANFALRRFPKSWTTKNPGVRFVMIQSAPLIALNQPDAFISAKVV